MTYTLRRIEAEACLDYVCKDHWRRFESSAEHDERVEAAQETASRLFHASTTGQKAALDGVLAVWPANYCPRNERIRDAARRAYEAATAEAFDLYVRSVDEILATGEISEETGSLWDALPLVVDLREVA